MLLWLLHFKHYYHYPECWFKWCLMKVWIVMKGNKNTLRCFLSLLARLCHDVDTSTASAGAEELRGAEIGCHKGWLTGRSLREKKLPLTHTPGFKTQPNNGARYLVLHGSFQTKHCGTTRGVFVLIKEQSVQISTLPVTHWMIEYMIALTSCESLSLYSKYLSILSH